MYIHWIVLFYTSHTKTTRSTFFISRSTVLIFIENIGQKNEEILLTGESSMISILLSLGQLVNSLLHFIIIYCRFFSTIPSLFYMLGVFFFLHHFQKPLETVALEAAVVAPYAVYHLKLLRTKSLQSRMHVSFHRAKRSRARIKFWLKTWKI